MLNRLYTHGSLTRTSAFFSKGPEPAKMALHSFQNGGAAELEPEQKHFEVSNERHDPHKPLGFLDLPREIRDQVYESLLCADYFDENACWSWHGPSFGITILYANRQIYTEAREVMLKGNKFVRVLTRGVNLYEILDKVLVQVVVHSYFMHDDVVIQDFKGAVMSYLLRDEGAMQEAGQENTCSVVILGRDLDAFVRGVSDPLIAGPRMDMSVKHHITMHDPLKKSRDPKHSDLRAQERLLQPFRDHFQGFAQVVINGEVDETLAANVMREVKQETVPDPDEIVASIRKLKDEGNAFLRAGELQKATQRWPSALDEMNRLRLRRIWPRVKSQRGPEFVDTMAELFFNLHSNQLQAALMQIRQEHVLDDDAVSHELETISRESTLQATTASEAFESTWIPSARQQAKLCFRVAQAARLMGEYEYAAISIERAMGMQPNDMTIRREADEIERAMLITYARMGGIQIPGM